MPNMPNTVNWKHGVITYNEFHIDLCKPLEEQIFELEEDLLQVKYADRYTLDVGWHPSLDPDGFLWIRIIEDYDWSEPLLDLKVKRVDKFIGELQAAIDFMDVFLKENPNRPLRPNPFV